jgi:hypothetical protein
VRPAESTASGPIAVAPVPHLPIVRMRSLLLRTEVVAIYDTHVLRGTRFLRRSRITEEMCQTDGERVLSEHLHQRTSIEFKDIRDIREKLIPRPPRWLRVVENLFAPFGVTPVVGSCNFTLRSNNSQRLRFSVLASQEGHVRGVFAAKRPDSYWIKESRQILPFVLVFFGLLLLLAAWFNFASGSLGSSLLFFGFGLPYFLVGYGYSLPLLRFWKRIGDYSSISPETAHRGWRLFPRRQHPFRSKSLGWALKALGVVYWLVVATGLSAPRQKAGEDLPAVASMLSILQPVYNGFVWAPAPLLILFGSRLCQRSYDPLGKSDARKPILYLRPFEDDAKTTLQPAGMLAALTGLRSWRPMGWSKTSQENDGIYIRDILTLYYPVRLLRMIFDHDAGSSEECLVRFFEAYGPVVAIGKPGETMATPGAARMYVEDDRWQMAIQTELRKAQAVVVQPSTSAGVRWELEQIRAHVDAQRVLFCLVRFWRRPQAYEELSHLVRTSFRLELPRVVPYLGRPAFILFNRDWDPRVQEVSYKCPALWPVFADATDLNYALQPFLQGMHGGEREEPRPARWKEGSGTWFASALATAIAMVVLWAVFTGAMFVVHSVQGLFGLSVEDRSSQRGTTAQFNSPFATEKALARTTYSGKKVRYRLRLTPDWQPKEAGENQDFAFQRGNIQLFILADAAAEDLSSVPDAFSNRLKELGKVTITVNGKIAVKGKEWLDLKFKIANEGRANVWEYVRAYSGPEGTVMLLAVVRGDGAEDQVAVYEAFESVELP